MSQYNPSNKDTNGAEESVIVSEVSSFQRLKEWYLGWEKVSCLERCPQFKCMYMYILCRRVVFGVRKGAMFSQVSSCFKILSS